MSAVSIECRGWKEICEFIGVNDKRTAKKKLRALKLLAYEDGRPILNKQLYIFKSQERNALQGIKK
jgi:hypothetical protein